MKKQTVFIALFITWFFACAFISYQGQFISGYLESRGFLQEKYAYPTSGVIFTCGLYTLVSINYCLLLLSKTTIHHPFLAYLIASLIPFAICFMSFLGAMHAPNYWGALIMIMMLTIIFHTFVLPFILYHYSKKMKQAS